MKVFITGISGYIGSLLFPFLSTDSSIQEIIGIDLKEPEFNHRKLRFIKCDVRSLTLSEVMKGCDVGVHLAFIVQEIRNKKLIYEINIHGTKNFLDACIKNKIRKVVIASSVAAYGCHPRSYIITEEAPLLGNRSSYYSDTKRKVEEMLDEFERENRNTIVTRIRPSILCGKNTSNFFRDILTFPVVMCINTNKEGLPLVWEMDVARVFYKVIVEDHPGAFNIHAGNLSPYKIAEKTGKRIIVMPYPLARILISIGYFSGILRFSKHWLELGRYPFHISTEKARRILGWQPTKNAEEAFDEMLTS